MHRNPRMTLISGLNWTSHGHDIELQKSKSPPAATTGQHRWLQRADGTPRPRGETKLNQLLHPISSKSQQAVCTRSVSQSASQRFLGY